MCSLVKKLTEVWEKEGDVTFLKEDFASRGEVTKDWKFYEIEDPDLGAPNQPVEEEVNYIEPQPPGASGSDTLNEPTPMEQDQEEVKLRQSERGRIPRRRFEIDQRMRKLARNRTNLKGRPLI